MMMEKCNESGKRSRRNILPETFLVMQLCGLWQPFNYNYQKCIYILYSMFVLFIVISVGLSLILFIFISSERIKEALIEHSFLLFTLLNAWVKIFIFLSRQQDIKSLLNTLLEEQCQPKDKTEHEIQKEFDTKVKKVTIIYSTMIALGVTFLYISILISDEKVQALYTWRPYDMKFHFWITWIHEYIGHLITASIHIVGDTMVPGFIMQLCCQLKLLEYRLNKLPRQVENIRKTLNSDMIKKSFESSFISQSVKHHNTIFWFAEKIKNLFVEILFAQFVTSFIAICVTIYKISKHPLDYETSLALFPFVFCMMMELFIYCFYGNELMFISSDLQKEIFEINWLFLGKETKKSLIIMMIRSRKPILISIASIAFVNLNSFASILKASYSAFNVLQHSV